MTETRLTSKLANVPLARPECDALNMSAPVLVQMNPEGKWESTKPGNLDEERLKTVIQHLVSSKAVSAGQSYCCQCAAEHRKEGKSNYVPVIMMPIYPAAECPFDIKCEIQKIEESYARPSKQKAAVLNKNQKDSEKEKDKKKLKKRGFVMQRLTDFDLLSQW